MAIDQFAAWRKRLKGEFVPIINEHPEPGFYRNRGVPVAYWFEADPKFEGEWTGAERGGVLRCHEAGRPVASIDRMATLWSFAVKEPVTKGAYDEFIRTGTWPDQSAAVTLSNQMPVDDNTIEGLTAQINMLANEADMLMKKGAAQTQMEADHAADVATRLGELNAKADNLRKAEKAPHWDKAVAVDNKWRSIIVASSIYTNIKAVIINPFLKAENARRQKEADDAADKAAFEASERVRLQREADDKARAAVESSGDHAHHDGAPADLAFHGADFEAPYVPPAPMQQPTPAFVPASAGSRGRKVSGRKVMVAKIIDYDKALAAFKAHPNIKDEVQRLANAQAKIGMPVDGCEFIEDSAAV